MEQGTDTPRVKLWELWRKREGTTPLSSQKGVTRNKGQPGEQVCGILCSEGRMVVWVLVAVTSQGGGLHLVGGTESVDTKLQCFKGDAQPGRPWQPAAVNIRLKAPLDTLQLPVKDVYSSKDCPEKMEPQRGTCSTKVMGDTNPRAPGRVRVINVHCSFTFWWVRNMRTCGRKVDTEWLCIIF